MMPNADRDAVVAALVRGHASAYGVSDDYDTIFDHGTFAAWLANNPNAQVPIHWFHQMTKIPIGISVLLQEDRHGLYFEADIHEGREPMQMLRAMASGAVRRSSLSFRLQDSYWENGKLHFSALDLVEISICTYASNPQTTSEIIECPALGITANNRAARGPEIIRAFETQLQQLDRRFQDVNQT